jgi:hypothetical protein
MIQDILPFSHNTDKKKVLGLQKQARLAVLHYIKEVQLGCLFILLRFII